MCRQVGVVAIATILWSVVAHSEGLPSMVDINQRLDAIQLEISQPERIWGAGYDNLSTEELKLLSGPWRKRLEISLALNQARKYLLEGKGIAFHDQLVVLYSKLEEAGVNQHARKSIQFEIVQLLVLAVESRLVVVTVEQFGAALSALDSNLEADEHRRAMATLAYLRDDVRTLVSIADRMEKLEDRGYALLLLSSIDASQGKFEEMILALQHAHDAFEDQSRARIALHLARAYLLLAQISSRVQDLQLAKHFAGEASAQTT